MHNRINSLLNDHKAKKRTSLHSHSKYHRHYQGSRKRLVIRVSKCSHRNSSSLIFLLILRSLREICPPRTSCKSWGRSKRRAKAWKAIKQISQGLWARRRRSQSRGKRSLTRSLRKYNQRTGQIKRKSLSTSLRKKSLKRLTTHSPSSTSQKSWAQTAIQRP